jgi:hypothetical protein
MRVRVSFGEKHFDENVKFRTNNLSKKMSSKHFRKRRRKRVEFVAHHHHPMSSSPLSNLIMFLLLYTVFITSTILINCVRAGQRTTVAYDDLPTDPSGITEYQRQIHTTNRARHKPNENSFNTTTAAVSRARQSLDNLIDEYENDVPPIPSPSGIRSNEDHVARDKLLRKLSSTILLESLLFKRPESMQKHSLSDLLNLPITPNEIMRTNHSKKNDENSTLFIKKNLGTLKSMMINRNQSSSHIPPTRKGVSLMLEADTTNQSNSISTEQYIHEDGAKSNQTNDSFNQKSLNYLVDKLLSLSTPNMSPTTVSPLLRPPTRLRSHQHNVINPSASTRGTNYTTSKPTLTLDMLIKDEYDSRVQPMLEQLKNQQSLSMLTMIQNRPSTIVDRINHRLNETMSGSEATSTMSTSRDFNKSTPTSTTIEDEKPNSAKEAPSSDEDSDEYEDSSSENDEEKPDSGDEDSAPEDGPQTTATPKMKKILRNVPPYQLGGFTQNQLVHNQQTTLEPSHTRERQTTAIPFGRANTIKPTTGTIKINKFPDDTKRSLGDRTTVASSLDSLVFSDGAVEAERIANRRNDRPTTRASSSTQRGDLTKQAQNDIKGDNFLLNQLFSTVSPLTELNLKLNDQSINLRDSLTKNSIQLNNPLIYKGYVGKDDYLLSTTSSDWSRPIGSSRDGSTSRYLSTTTTTPSPSTEPPTVPYNYYLNQPVTNAQSVPAMVIPTSDMPPIEPPSHVPHMIHSAKSPLPSSARIPTVVHFEQSLSTTDGNPVTPNSNHSTLTSNRKYSYRVPDGKQLITALQEANLHGAHDMKGSRYPSSFGNGREPARESYSPKVVTLPSNKSNSTASNPVGSSWFPTAGTQVEATKVTTTTQHNNTLQANQTNAYDVKTMLSDHFGHNGGSGSGSVAEGSVDDPDNNRGVPSSDANFASERNKIIMGDNGFSHAKSNFDVQRNKSRDSNPERDLGLNRNEYGGDIRSPTQIDKTKIKRPNDVSQSRGKVQDTQNQQHKFINHEPAGSELTQTSLERFGAKQSDLNDNVADKETDYSIRFKHPKRSSESTLVSGSSGNNQSSIDHAVDSLRELANGGRPAGPFSNVNFFSEASFERPIMDNSISLFSNPTVPHQGGHRHNIDTPTDPYQRTSSNTILSSVQQPVSTTSAPTIGQPSVGTATTTQISTTKDIYEQTSDTMRPVTKSSNDRLAFILIGGSCVLSVVCLVLAAMSMRCQDMCDDYQSLRNAEKAAMKLQKHRLKFTKNHRINKFKHGLSSSGSGQNLIDDFNIENNNMSNGDRFDVDLNQSRDMRHQTNAKTIQFSDNALKQDAAGVNWAQKNSESALNAAVASSHHNHLSSALADSAAIQICGCENCSNRRLMLHDDFVVNGSKHLSWLHPYYHLQHPIRFRPLFGAGSSVSTFFPQNRPERLSRGANGLVDAHALIESGNTKQAVTNHSCSGATGRSKSILSKSKNCAPSSSSRHANNHQHQHHSTCANVNGLGNVLESANSLEHEHQQHNCCHHNHNYHRCNHQDVNDTTASDESESTCNELLNHCDHHPHHCPREHQFKTTDTSNKVKLIQMAKLNSQQSSGWKKHSTDASQIKQQHLAHGYGNDNHHHHHHHHRHNDHNHGQHLATASSDSSSLPQCTCAHHHYMPTVTNLVGGHKSSQAQKNHKRDAQESNVHRQQAKRDKSMLIWSTNRDRLI